MGICDHSSRSSFVRSDSDVGQEGLARSFCSIPSQRCSVRAVKLFHARLADPRLYEPCLVHWRAVMLAH